MLAFITVIGNSEHDQYVHSVIKVYRKLNEQNAYCKLSMYIIISQIEHKIFLNL